MHHPHNLNLINLPHMNIGIRPVEDEITSLNKCPGWRREISAPYTQMRQIDQRLGPILNGVVHALSRRRVIASNRPEDLEEIFSRVFGPVKNRSHAASCVSLSSRR